MRNKNIYFQTHLLELVITKFLKELKKFQNVLNSLCDIIYVGKNFKIFVRGTKYNM